MKFEIDREVLLRPLQLVAGVVERHQTLPILSNMHLQANGGALSLTATDLNEELVARVADVEVAGEGEATVPAQKLSTIWRSLPEGARVSLEVENQFAVLKSGRSRFSLATLPVDDFPRIEEVKGEVEFTLSSAEAMDMIDRVSFAMAQQDVRYFLNGMLLEVTAEHVRTVSTDGHRLCQFTLGKGVADMERVQAIVPRKVVLELRRLLDDGEDELHVSLSDKGIRVTKGMFSLTSKLIDGKFPDYERVIPQDPKLSISGDRETFSRVLQRSRILASDRAPCVKLTVEGEQMTVVASNAEGEEAKDIIAVDYSGETVQLAFNPDYLLDVTRVLGTKTVRLGMAEAGSSALIEAVGDESALYVVMPMRI